ncbi:unnamed protein product [Moneuplotes crassus]|uniref:Uncharacterized protein n=1 Tax=Euplotes crassus TaxID=5936 RepID=A0AAD1XB67_EUPCR|nr:unnamed protein product [Moneuplotes crassus]
MESLPTCFKASCNDQAVYLVEEEDVYVCNQHFSGRYENGIPLKSQDDVRDNTSILKQALNVFSCFTKGANKEELPEDVESLLQKLTKDTEEIQTEFSKVKDPILYHKFGIIQANIDKVREFMESEPLFRAFMSNWFWDCMKKYN